MTAHMTDVKALRIRLGLSQKEFVTRFGLSLTTLQSWEQGRRTPDCTAKILLAVIARSPEIVVDAIEASR